MEQSNNSERFAVLDELGYPVAFYWGDIHAGRIPEEAVQITLEQWQECIDNQGTRRFDDGVLIPCENRRLPVDDQWAAVRETRNYLLSSCDWTQLLDAQALMSDDTKAAWATYRSELRSVPQNNDDPFSIEWPVAPNEVIS